METNIVLFSLLGAVNTVRLTQKTFNRPFVNLFIGFIVGDIFGLGMNIMYAIFDFNHVGSLFITYFCAIGICYTVLSRIYYCYTKKLHKHSSKCDYLHDVEYVIDLPFFKYYKRYNDHAHVQSIVQEQSEEIKLEEVNDSPLSTSSLEEEEAEVISSSDDCELEGDVIMINKPDVIDVIDESQ